MRPFRFQSSSIYGLDDYSRGEKMNPIDRIALREKAAIAAMQGFLSNHNVMENVVSKGSNDKHCNEMVAEMAVCAADALIRELEK